MNCTVTGQPMNKCEHCLDPNYLVLDPEGPPYETIGGRFRSQFRGTCCVEPRHDIRKGEFVSRVRRADNPAIIVRGVACKNCTIDLPRGKN